MRAAVATAPGRYRIARPQQFGRTVTVGAGVTTVAGGACCTTGAAVRSNQVVRLAQAPRLAKTMVGMPGRTAMMHITAAAMPSAWG